MTRQTTTRQIRNALRPAVAAAALLVLLSGCAALFGDLVPDPLNSKEQIAALEDTLNENDDRTRSNLSDHLHPGVGATFNDPQTWQQVFKTDVTYTFENVLASSETDPNGLSLYTATISAAPDDGGDPTTDAIHAADITFGMERDSAGDGSSMVRTITIANHNLGTGFDDPYEFIRY